MTQVGYSVSVVVGTIQINADVTLSCVDGSCFASSFSMIDLLSDAVLCPAC